MATPAVLLVLLLVAALVQADDVYRSVNAQGVVTFSDVKTPGAEAVQLHTPEPNALAAAEQSARIDQQLKVAGALEASRLAREAARTRRLEALAAVPRTVVVQTTETRYLGGYSHSYGSWRPGLPPLRPGHPRPPGRPHPPKYPPSGDGDVAPPPSMKVKFPSSGRSGSP